MEYLGSIHCPIATTRPSSIYDSRFSSHPNPSYHAQSNVVHSNHERGCIEWVSSYRDTNTNINEYGYLSSHTVPFAYPARLTTEHMNKRIGRHAWEASSYSHIVSINQPTNSLARSLVRSLE